MKKKQKLYAVNNQEDEDGYTLDPANAITNENTKRKLGISSGNTTEDTEPGTEKLQSRSFTLSPLSMLRKISNK
jgi:hypothetical protein